MSSPVVVTTWTERIERLLKKEEAENRLLHRPSGQISASMMYKPTLECVLRLLGVPGKEFDARTLGKFERGNQVEAWLTEAIMESKPGSENYSSQRTVSYRGCIGIADILQHTITPRRKVRSHAIPHEVKSVTSYKYKRITQGGWGYEEVLIDGRWEKQKVMIPPGPDLGHVYQGTFYGLATDSQFFYLHYVNADDLQVTSFEIPTALHQEFIDKHIDEIEMALASGQLPAWESFLDWHDNPMYSDYPEYLGYYAAEAEERLKRDHPEIYDKLKKEP